LPRIELIPAVGVNVENMAGFVAAGAYLVAACGNMASQAQVTAGEFA
jgi:2-keto-3-deoxy-6-phosphogluconate aldolase